jgi:hypothetical protein
MGVIGLTGLAACSSSQKVVNTPSATATTSPSNTSAEATGTTVPKPKVAHVGDTVSLPADRQQQTPPAQLTLVKVVDPAHSANQYETPESGKRFVGVQLRIVVQGSSSVQSVPSNNTTVFDAQGQSYSSTFATLADCQEFASNLVISPNEPVLGCVAFQVPTTAKVTKVKFTPASGFASVTAEWQVP